MRMDSQHIKNQTMPPVSGKRHWDLVVVSLILVLPFVVQAAYFNGGFYYDDDFHLDQCRLIDQREISLSDYVTLPHGEHLIPLWKLMFYGCWSLFGDNSAAFHFFMAAFHIASALCLLVLLRTYVQHRAAAVAAVLWAGAAVGGWDGPFLWIAASHLAVGATFFLAAMLCLTRFNEHHDKRWAGLMSVLLLTALLTMHALIVLTPVLVLQYLLFERQRDQDQTRAIRWLAALVVPCVIITALHFTWVKPAIEKLDRPPTNILAGLQMLGGGYAASSWNLVFWKGSAVLWGRVAGAAILAALLLRTSRSAQKVGLLFFSLSFCFSVLAYMARSGWDVDHVLMWGRYRYLPTLFWVVLLGVVLDRGLAHMTVHRPQIAKFAPASFLLLFVVAQCRIAAEAANVFRHLSSESKHATAPDEKTQVSVFGVTGIDIDRSAALRIQSASRDIAET